MSEVFENNNGDVWDDLDEDSIDMPEAFNGDSLEESDNKPEEVKEVEKEIEGEESSDSKEEKKEESDIKEEKEDDTKENDSKDKTIKPDSKEVESKESSLESLQSQIDSGELSLSISVDGKKEEVSIQELKNNYSGKVHYDKKFTELDNERKAYEADYKKISVPVASFAEKVRNDDVVGAFEDLGTFAKIPSYMMKEKLIAALTPEIHRRAGLTNEQVQTENLTAQNDYLKEKQESDNKILQEEQATSELQNKIMGIRETHKIDEQEWNTALKELDTNLPKEVVITPELMQEEILSTRINLKAVTALETFDKPLGEDKLWIDSITKIISENPDFTEQDLQEVIAGGAKITGYKTIASKLEKKIGKKSASPKQEKQQEPEEVDEDLAELFG